MLSGWRCHRFRRVRVDVERGLQIRGLVPQFEVPVTMRSILVTLARERMQVRVVIAERDAAQHFVSDNFFRHVVRDRTGSQRRTNPASRHRQHPTEYVMEQPLLERRERFFWDSQTVSGAAKTVGGKSSPEQLVDRLSEYGMPCVVEQVERCSIRDHLL